MQTWKKTTTRITCPICNKDSLPLEQSQNGALRVPQHLDIREMVLEQPRCPGSEAGLVLVRLDLIKDGRAVLGTFRHHSPGCADCAPHLADVLTAIVI